MRLRLRAARLTALKTICLLLLTGQSTQALSSASKGKNPAARPRSQSSTPSQRWQKLGAPKRHVPEEPAAVDPLWAGLGAPSERRVAAALDPEIEARVTRLMASMSTREKVGQLLFVGFGGYEVDSGGAIERLVKGKEVGGIALFSRNIRSISQVARFTAQLRALLPKVPPFIAVDQEGGNVVRLREPATVLPSNMALGAANDFALTTRAADAMGHDLWLLGFNMNLAPVLDVNSNPHNPVIGIRSFGENPYRVGNHGAAFVQGLQGAGVSGVAKHFPGHGDTGSDSHYAMPSLPHDRERLLSLELVPFQRAIEAGLDAVMTAHISLPAIEGEEGVPATVSHKVLTGLLRETLGFEGIILTDGLEMKGIVDAYGSGPAAVKAIQAGADMVLILWTKERKEEVHRALLSAVAQGSISSARLDQSVRRILRTKLRRGVVDRPPPSAEQAIALLGNGKRGHELAREISEKSVTTVISQVGLTPIDRKRFKRILLLSADDTFIRELGRRIPGVRSVRTASVPTHERRSRDIASTLRLCHSSDLLIVAALNQYQTDMIQVIRPRCKLPILMVSLGSPYLLEVASSVDAYVTSYSFQGSSSAAVARFLAGEIASKGTLPVSLPSLEGLAPPLVAPRSPKLLNSAPLQALRGDLDRTLAAPNAIQSNGS